MGFSVRHQVNALVNRQVLIGSPACRRERRRWVSTRRGIMKRISKLLIPAALSLCVATIADAQASRTWVSGVGDDANPCSRTAPCKTWAGAISKTANFGEIDALDPGGFGAVTITKAITF